MKIKSVVALLAVIVFMFAFPTTASAAASDITSVPEFNDIDSGDGRFLSDTYRDNYYLDIEKLSLLEGDQKLMNNMANNVFSFLRHISYFTVVLFYHSFALNIAGMFGSEIYAIVVSLRRILFDGAVFYFVFAMSAWYMVKQLLRGNLQNLLSEVLKVIAILVISLSISLQALPFLTFVNTASKQLSIEALGGIARQNLNDGENIHEAEVNKYAANASSILWSSLVHKPWLSLQFNDYSPSDDQVRNFLAQEPQSESRQQLVEGLDSAGIFTKNAAGRRLGYSFFLVIPIILKCALFIVIAFFLIWYQIQTLFYVLTCPLVLVMAVSPAFGGMDLITKWLKKIFETQFAMLILSITVGLIVKFDTMIFTRLADLGWLMAFAFQIIIIAALYMNRNRLLSGVLNFNHAIQNPHAMLDRVSNLPDEMAHAAENTAQNALYTSRGITQNALYRGRGMIWALEYKMRSGSSTNYQKVSQYKPDRRQESPQAPEPAAPAAPSAPENINDAVETVQQSEKTNTGKVIDYSKIPRYQKRIPQNPDTLQQQSVSLSYGTVAANGDVIPNYQNNTSQSMLYKHSSMKEYTPHQSMANVPVYVPKSNKGLEQSEATKTEKTANNKDSTPTQLISNTRAFTPQSSLAQNLAVKKEPTANNKGSVQTRSITNTPAFVPKSNPAQTVTTKTETVANYKTYTQSQSITNTPVFVPQSSTAQNIATKAKEPQAAKNKKAPEPPTAPTPNRGQAPQPPANLSARTPIDPGHRQSYSTKMDVRTFMPKKSLDKAERPQSIHVAAAKNKKS